MLPFLAVLFAIYVSINGYYVSLNSFEQREAELFCENHCNSNLASIHDDIQNNELIDLITYTITHITFTYDYTPFVYLGLTDKSSEGNYYWTDGDVYNYNNFGSGEPGSSDCLALQKNTYNWVMKGCSNGQQESNNDLYIFACNSCDGVLTKYIIIDDFDQTYAQQLTECENTYETGLASYHNIDDFNDAAYLIELANSQSAYSGGYETHAFIGLYENNGNLVFNWEDGTEFDYGVTFNVDPWSSTQPDGSGDCGVHTYTTDKWIDGNCGNRYMAICNAPSEICDSTEWSIIRGTGWSFTTRPCQVVNNYDVNSIALIDGKRWDNDIKSFVLEYMYTMNSVDATDGGTAGIIWHVDTICNNYYYIGISSIDSKVFIAEIKNDEINIIQSISLGFTYSTGTFYLLRIEIMGGDTFTISVNGNILLNNIVSDLFSNSGIINIGYIGIQNTKSSITVKSLYISGKLSLETNNNNVQSWFDTCTTTINPTTNPISQATIDPTTNPTPSPTTNPTTNPILQPTNNPSKLSTLSPTVNPSKHPITLNPTTNPIKQLTFKPTDRPTIKADIIDNEKTNEGAIETTETAIDTTTKTILDLGRKPSSSPLWTVFGIVLTVILICCFILCVIFYLKKKKVDDANKDGPGRDKGKSVSKISMMNGPRKEEIIRSDSEAQQDGINDDLTIAVMTGNINSNNDVFGEYNEDHTGSIEDKGTHSSYIHSSYISSNQKISPAACDNQIIIAAEDESPGNTESNADTGDTGDTAITGESEQNNDNHNDNDNDNDSDEKYYDNNRERGYTDNGGAKLDHIDHKKDCLSIKEWLEMNVKLPQYFDDLIQNGYDSLDIIKEITEREQLIDIGIILRGHQTKILAEIKKLRQFEEQRNDDHFLPYNAGYNVELQFNEKDEYEGDDQIVIGDDEENVNDGDGTPQ